jgi:hypothetical protein
MSDNRIKIHKNLDRNDGPALNKVNLTGLHVEPAASFGGAGSVCLLWQRLDLKQFGDLGRPVGFPDANF